MTDFGTDEAKKASLEFINKIKKGEFHLKTLPNTSEEMNEEKAYKSGMALSDSNVLKDAIKRF